MRRERFDTERLEKIMLDSLDGSKDCSYFCLPMHIQRLLKDGLPRTGQLRIFIKYFAMVIDLQMFEERSIQKKRKSKGLQIMGG